VTTRSSAWLNDQWRKRKKTGRGLGLGLMEREGGEAVRFCRGGASAGGRPVGDAARTRSAGVVGRWGGRVVERWGYFGYGRGCAAGHRSHGTEVDGMAPMPWPAPGPRGIRIESRAAERRGRIRFAGTRRRRIGRPRSTYHRAARGRAVKDVALGLPARGLSDVRWLTGLRVDRLHLTLFFFKKHSYILHKKWD
jgi:hypothetical protein